MKKTGILMTAAVTALALCLAPVTVANADSDVIEGYVCFGDDLEENQKLQVMTGLGVSAVTLANYKQDTVTNAEEHKYLDAYLDSSVIGTKALSSVAVKEGQKGTGIVVQTHNINYCTVEMYTNALATAGFEDVDVRVSAPSEISGTAALVGAMKAYGALRGQPVDDAAVDAANNELVLTGQIGEAIGSDEAAELVAIVKNRIMTDGITDESQMKQVINTAAKEMNVDLNDTQVDQMVSLMKKIDGLNLDINTVKSQAGDVYEKIKALNIDPDQAIGFMGKVGRFFKNLWAKFLALFGM